VALKPPNTVNAGPIVVTGSGHTIIHIDLTQYAQSSYATETNSISWQDIAQRTKADNSNNDNKIGEVLNTNIFM
jgi:hypothetical protein